MEGGGQGRARRGAEAREGGGQGRAAARPEGRESTAISASRLPLPVCNNLRQSSKAGLVCQSREMGRKT